ncbi:MAG: O-antigen ligase family protein [Gemmatimonadaceae bacterium]
MTPAVARPYPTSRLALVTALIMSVVMVLRPHELVPGLALIRPVILMMLFGGWVLLTQTPWHNAMQDVLTKRYAALLGWAMLTLPFAIYRAIGIPTLQKLIVMVLLVALMAAMPVAGGTTRTLLRWYLLAFIGYGTLVLVKGVQSAEAGRLSGISSYDPNELAALCSLSLAFALGSVRSRGFLPRVIGLAAAVIATLIVLRTGSRGGAIGIAVVLALFVLALPRVWILPGLLLVLLAAAGGWAVAPPTFKERVQSIGSLNEDYNTSAYGGRKAIWTRGLSYLRDHPITGVGISNYSEAEGQALAAIGKRGLWYNAHNMFVQIGAELGVPGLLLMLFLLASAFKAAGSVWSSRDGPPAYPEALGALASFVTTGLFLSMAYSEMLAFVAAIAMLAQRERWTVRQQTRRGWVGPTPASMAIPMPGADPAAMPTGRAIRYRGGGYRTRPHPR